MNLKFSAKQFDDLTVHELHDALQLRTNTFVVEQACLYTEVDGRDPASSHVLVKDQSDVLIAYARIIPPEEGDLPHIGRVVVHIDHRGKGIARELMAFTLEMLKQYFGSRRSALAAQSHLEKFYAGFDYIRHGEEYIWDGIPHMDMVREKD